MCATCGCGDGTGARIVDLDLEPAAHGHGHGHGHRTISLEVDLLAKNDELAAANRGWLADRGIFAVNLMSSPGAGKTTLLERTVRELTGRVPVAVLEGDQETALDAARIRASGCRVVQVNTGAGCHLDAMMVRRGLDALRPPDGSLVFIENVGNLVCPALFDLGESARVVVTSVTEGADKPLKYPHMFRAAQLLLINKVDLLPYVDFDPEECAAAARRANPAVEVLLTSATEGDGLGTWENWLCRRG